MLLLVLKNAAANYDAGDIVECRANGAVVTTTELATFGVLSTIDPMSGGIGWANQPWNKSVNVAITNTDTATDTISATLSASNMNSAGRGALVSLDVASFLSKWGATIGTVAANSISITVKAYNALTSNGFWSIPAALYNQIVFSETNYDSSTQTHTIQADYSALNVSPTWIETIVVGHGCTVVSHANKIITFTAVATLEQPKFISDLQEAGAVLVKPFRYQINATLLAQVVAETNSTLSTDIATIAAAVIDKTVL